MPTLPRSGHRGFSLMEAVVVIAVTAVMMVVLSQVFVANFNLAKRQFGRLDSEGSAIAAIRSLGELTRSATGIMTNWTVNGTLYTSNRDQLVLRLPSLDANGDPTGSERDYIAVFRDAADPTLIMTDTQPSAASARHAGLKLLTAYNATLAFSYNDVEPSRADRVSVFLVNSTKPPHTVIVSKAWTSIFMRNY